MGHRDGITTQKKNEMKANEGGGMMKISDDMKYSGMGNSSMWNVIYFFFIFICKGNRSDCFALCSFFGIWEGDGRRMGGGTLEPRLFVVKG